MIILTQGSVTWTKPDSLSCKLDYSQSYNLESAKAACLKIEHKCGGIVHIGWKNCPWEESDYYYYGDLDHYYRAAREDFILCTLGTSQQSNAHCVSQPSTRCPNIQCNAHTKCPHGKYTKAIGSTTGQPQCEHCAAGFFKSALSDSSMETDFCTAVPSIQCPAGKSIKISSERAPQCEGCKSGFFKPTLSIGTEANSCTPHTKCPPGKYTKVGGSATSQPQCEECSAGFYKASTSTSSTCVATAKGEFVRVSGV